MSSSQLTFIFFRGVGIPPTSFSTSFFAMFHCGFQPFLVRNLQEEFLGKLKAIKGISTVETQTYTLEEVGRELEELDRDDLGGFLKKVSIWMCFISLPIYWVIYGFIWMIMLFKQESIDGNFPNELMLCHETSNFVHWEKGLSCRIPMVWRNQAHRPFSGSQKSEAQKLGFDRWQSGWPWPVGTVVMGPQDDAVKWLVWCPLHTMIYGDMPWYILHIITNTRIYAYYNMNILYRLYISIYIHTYIVEWHDLIHNIRFVFDQCCAPKKVIVAFPIRSPLIKSSWVISNPRFGVMKSHLHPLNFARWRWTRRTSRRPKKRRPHGDSSLPTVEIPSESSSQHLVKCFTMPDFAGWNSPFCGWTLPCFAGKALKFGWIRLYHSQNLDDFNPSSWCLNHVRTHFWCLNPPFSAPGEGGSQGGGQATWGSRSLVFRTGKIHGFHSTHRDFTHITKLESPLFALGLTKTSDIVDRQLIRRNQEKWWFN